MARHGRRLIHWLLWVVAALLLLAVGTAVALWVWIDPDDWRGEVAARASAAIGRPVRLTGALRWQPGKRIIVYSDGGEVANAAGFGAEPLLRWSHLQFEVAARPLLDRQLQIGSIRIDGAQLNLQRNASGAANWNLSPPVSAAPAQSLAYTIGSVELSDATLRYRDAAAGDDWQVTALTARAQLPEDLATAIQEFRNVQLQGAVAGGPLAGGVPFEVQAPALRWSPAEVALPQFKARWAEAAVQGEFRAQTGTAPAGATPISAVPEVAAHIALQAPSLRALFATANIQMPATRDSHVFGKLEMSATLHRSAGVIRVDDLAMALDDTRVTGHVFLPRLQPFQLRFDLAADHLDLDRYREPGKGKPLELPQAWLKRLDAGGALRIREARIEGAVAKDVRIDVR